MLIKDVTDPEDKAKWEFIQECVKNPDKNTLFLVCEYLYHLIDKGYMIYTEDLNYFEWPSYYREYKLEHYSHYKLIYTLNTGLIYKKKQ